MVEVDEKPALTLSHLRMTIQVRPGSPANKRAEIMHEWHKAQLHVVLPGLIDKWEDKLDVAVADYFLQRMNVGADRKLTRSTAIVPIQI